MLHFLLVSSQHGRMVKMCLVMGARCLVGLISLTTAYSSVLVSFIVAPHYRPLVDTLKELAQRDNVNPPVVNDLAVDVMSADMQDNI